MSELLEIRGTFRRLAWAANGDGHRFCIASVVLSEPDKACKRCKGTGVACTCSQISVKGDADPNEFIHDLQYRFWGKWAKANEYGRQFEFKQLKRDEPHSRVAVVGYLRQFATGIGPVYASQLWDAFGADAVRILRTDPVRAATTLGIPVAKARAASEALNTDGKNEDLRLELVQLFEGRHFPKKLVDQVIKLWGLAAPQRIRRDPFTLMVNRLPGCGFSRCDRLYLDLGLPQDRLKRQLMCVWRALKEDSNGNTWHPIQIAEKAIAEHISGIGEEKINWQRAVRLGVRAKWIVTRKDENGRWWIAESKQAANEKAVADDMIRLMQPCKNCGGTGGVEVAEYVGGDCIGSHFEECDCPQWPNPDDIEGLTPHHREQLKIAFQGRVCIITGDPGTGKTTAVSLVLSYMSKQLGSFRISVCAPTNLAAMRLISVMESHKLFGVNVATFHRTLGVDRVGYDGNGWGFFHNRDRKLPARVLVIDEDSMRDTDISSSLLQAVADGTLVVFLGDTNQLPPVGHGAPLRDGIAAGIPHGHFSQVLRNSGSITDFCQACRAGERLKPPPFIDLDRKHKWNWRHIPCGSPAGQKQLLAEMLKSVSQFEIDGKRIDPIRDTQVIVAVNEKGDLSRVELNTLVQSVLNPFGAQAEGNKFRVGDKVICGENCKLKLCDPADSGESVDDDEDSPEDYVANGELGYVLHVAKRHSIVELAGNRIVRVPVARGENNASGSFDLAYAVTVHKSQGSQWPIVFCLSDRTANRMGSRELWNTAGSRPTTLLVTIGELSTIERQCQRVALRDRKTFLTELIRDGKVRVHGRDEGSVERSCA